jgi:hypothetical protein
MQMQPREDSGRLSGWRGASSREMHGRMRMPELPVARMPRKHRPVMAVVAMAAMELARTSATGLVLKRLKRGNAHRRGVMRPGRKPARMPKEAETRKKRGFSGAFGAKNRGKRGEKHPPGWVLPMGKPSGAPGRSQAVQQSFR